MDGAGAKVEFLGDLGVGHPLGYQTEHLDLPGGEPSRILLGGRGRRSCALRRLLLLPTRALLEIEPRML